MINSVEKINTTENVFTAARSEIRTFTSDITQTITERKINHLNIENHMKLLHI